MKADSSSLPTGQNDLIEHVDNLSQEVKDLSLNLALYLSRARSQGIELSRLEPEFIRLVNGSIRVVKELTRLLGAARNTGGAPATGAPDPIALEQRLQAVLNQCASILGAIERENRRSSG